MLLSHFSHVWLWWPQRQQPIRLPHPWDSPGKNTGVGCHSLLQCMKVKSESEVTQLCLTLSDPMDCSLPGSSTHGIFQAIVLEWAAIVFSGEIYKASLKSVRQVLFWPLPVPLVGSFLCPRYFNKGKQWKQCQTLFFGLQNHCRWWLQPWN